MNNISASNFSLPAKRYSEFILTLVVIASLLIGLVGMRVMAISIHGYVCNFSAESIWITVSDSGRQKAAALSAGRCTNMFTQDVEAIWGNDCMHAPCHYQAWKVGAGHYRVYNDTGSILRIRGWGAGSSWHITWEWPKPELSSVTYSLVK